MCAHYHLGQAWEKLALHWYSCDGCKSADITVLTPEYGNSVGITMLRLSVPFSGERLATGGLAADLLTMKGLPMDNTLIVICHIAVCKLNLDWSIQLVGHSAARMQAMQLNRDLNGVEQKP